MTPKRKALELFNKYSKGKDDHGWNVCEFDSCAKKCALIAIDEKLNTLSGLEDSVWYFNTNSFLEEVKQEIEKL